MIYLVMKDVWECGPVVSTVLGSYSEESDANVAANALIANNNDEDITYYVLTKEVQ